MITRISDKLTSSNLFRVVCRDMATNASAQKRCVCACSEPKIVPKRNINHNRSNVQLRRSACFVAHCALTRALCRVSLTTSYVNMKWMLRSTISLSIYALFQHPPPSFPSLERNMGIRNGINHSVENSFAHKKSNEKFNSSYGPRFKSNLTAYDGWIEQEFNRRTHCMQRKAHNENYKRMEKKKWKKYCGWNRERGSVFVRVVHSRSTACGSFRRICAQLQRSPTGIH